MLLHILKASTCATLGDMPTCLRFHDVTLSVGGSTQMDLRHLDQVLFDILRKALGRGARTAAHGDAWANERSRSWANEPNCLQVMPAELDNDFYHGDNHILYH